MLPASLRDFSLNLLSEVIGILVTVFFVDRLLKRREDRRWAPAKNLLEARLFKLAEQIIFAVIGIGEGYEAWGKLRMYYFGEATVMSYCNAEQIDSKYIFRVIEANRARSESSRLRFDYRPFPEAQGKLNAILDTSAFLIDPEAIELLLQLDEELRRLITPRDDEGPDYGNVSALFDVAVKAISVRSHLQTKAKRVQSLQSSATQENRTLPKITLP
ncbi:MAG: hypothetical protein QOF62_1293 [Pyrinomonadaceae bacterium]|jgi:hypothetical protein|nr:hypothetical protein [Pyrinomonadaceae bacterium]